MPRGLASRPWASRELIDKIHTGASFAATFVTFTNDGDHNQMRWCVNASRPRQLNYRVRLLAETDLDSAAPFWKNAAP
ncbi:hypothetical protein I41_08990 [Lacipirellula limnantheis]|uniref:Uncharacterized protein n=1 Tax=Lacipirellula limnantheis TaxID=2528024 RepID=A0A517TTP1_9BACT|nr:hypothetical protein I41_08990 [Lacipirellula limnantheis]